MPVKVLVDGKQMPMSPPAMLRHRRVFLPVSAFLKLGLYVRPISKRQAVIGWPESEDIVMIKAGVRRYPEEYQGKKTIYTLPGTPFLYRGALMVPVHDMMSSGDIVGSWDQRTQVLTVIRDPEWLRYRIYRDAYLIREMPGNYGHIWLGKSLPAPVRSEIARAEKLERSGDWRSAERILNRLVNLRPFTWQPEIYPIREEWLAYGPLGAIMVRKHPDDGYGYLYHGIGLAIKGDYSGAEESFLHGVEVEPRPELLFAVGWAILRKEKVRSVFERRPETLRKALGYFERSLQKTPGYSLPLRSAGYASLHLAYLTNHTGGYTSKSKAEARPYLRKAAGYLEGLRAETGPDKRLDGLLKNIRKQLGEK